MCFICCSPPSSEGDWNTEEDSQSSPGSQSSQEPSTTESTSKKQKTISESDLRKEHDLREEKLSKERQRMKRWQMNMTGEKKKEYLSKARQRMQKIRQEKPKTLKTPSQIKKTREMWAAAKRNQRAKQTDEMKKENKIKTLITQMRKLYPDDLKRVIDSTVTPKKKKILTELSVYVSPKSRAQAETCATVTSELRLTVKHMSRKDKKTMAKKKELCSFLAKKKNSARFRILLGVSLRTWVRMKKDQDTKKKGNSTQILKCLKFYNDSAIPIPGKRFASKSVLPDTLRNLHKIFQRDSSRMSFSRFASLRPANILTVDNTKLVGCVCEYCVNLTYKVGLFLYLHVL